MKSLRGVVVLVVFVAFLALAPVGAQAPGTGAIEGTVTEWGTGEPVQGVAVSLASDAYTAVTDANGEYRISDISTGFLFSVFFDHPDDTYVDVYYDNAANWTNATRISAEEGETLVGIDAALQPERTLIGRIRDDQTGEPVEGLCAEVYNNVYTTDQFGQSDSEGWVRIDYAGSEYARNVVHLTDCNNLGYADEWYADLPSLGWTVGDEVFQQAADPYFWMRTLGRFDALVGRSGSIAGTVRDEGGQPVADICATVDAPDTGPLANPVLTDGSGGFRIDGLTAYDQYQLVYWDCGWPVEYAQGQVDGIAVASGVATTMPVVMTPTASISGTVINNSTGLPIEGLCLAATADPVYQSKAAGDRSDSLGRYSMAVPDAASYWVESYPCFDTRDRYIGEWFDDVPDFATATDLALAPGEVRTGVDFHLDSMAVISGTLTRSDGGPADGDCGIAILAVGSGPSHQGCVDEAGHYEINTILPGSYNVIFSGLYQSEYYDDVTEKADAVVFDLSYNDRLVVDAELQPAGSLSGQILPNSGVSFDQACVYLTDLDGTPLMTTTTDNSPFSSPFYGFRDILGGTYLMYAEDCDHTAPGFAPVWWRSDATRDVAEPIEVDQSNGTEMDIWVDAYPEQMTSVSGSVLKDGTPWDACVTVYDQTDTTVGSAVATGGTYTVDGIRLFGPAAALTVQAADCGGGDEAWYGGAVQAEAIAYDAGMQFSDIDISFDAEEPDPIVLTAAVKDLLGHALAGLCVAVVGEGVETTVVADSGGTAVFELIDPGTYDVIAGAAGAGCLAGYTENDARVTLTADATLALALGLDVPPFGDSNGSVFVGDIQWLAAAGVTLGCNPPVNDRFCPDQAVTRGQMAAFVVRALGLVDRGVKDFVDDDGSVFEADIERLAAAGVTLGCNPPVNDRFCPDQAVTRGQMAAFVRRTLS